MKGSLAVLILLESTVTVPLLLGVVPGMVAVVVPCGVLAKYTAPAIRIPATMIDPGISHAFFLSAWFVGSMCNIKLLE